jgi:hypothetical protein
MHLLQDRPPSPTHTPTGYARHPDGRQPPQLDPSWLIVRVCSELSVPRASPGRRLPLERVLLPINWSSWRSPNFAPQRATATSWVRSN